MQLILDLFVYNAYTDHACLLLVPVRLDVACEQTGCWMIEFGVPCYFDAIVIYVDDTGK